MSENTQEMQQVVTSKSTERKKKLPLFIGIAAVIVIGIVAVLSLTVFGGGSKTKKAMAQLDLGNKYLDELDFERAEAAFTAALQIDPKNADAYLGLIDLYAKTGDAKKLAKVYQDAKKEFTGSASTDEAELKKVKEKAASAIEKLVREALADGDYEKAEKYAEYLAKVDSGKADTLKTQIAEAERKAKEEAERKAAEEARIAAEKAEAERKAKEEAERKAKEEAERKAAFAKELEGVGTGEVITFGHYEQDNDTTNGAEPIDWVVLAKEADKMLVVSLYALDCQRYNTEYKDVTWEVCTLRNWLNDSFYNAAFGEEEKAKIVTVTNENPDSNGFWNSDYWCKNRNKLGI